ncbi:MAG: choice-of-anchor D domain-containing protein, partial [Saprospiraceae bacterium]
LRITDIHIDHPNATANIQTGKYWIIKALQTDKTTLATTDYTVDLTLPYATANAEDENCRYTGSWDCGANSYVANTSITRTGITQLSDWAVEDNPISEINVKGNNVSIADGDVMPSFADSTDFGNQSVCTSTLVRTYTIENSGPGTLNVTAISTSGGQFSEFVVGGISLPAAVSAGSSKTFTVTFDPTALGIRSTTLNISNDDSDENPYNFSIQGNGIDPEIELRGNNTIILDGDTSPDLADHTDFGQTTSAPITRTFKIKNIENLDLILLSGAITITGTNASLFTVSNVSLPATINGPTGMLTFDVTYTPIATGIHTATVNIASNDCDESPFDFAIKGEQTCTPPTFSSCPNTSIIVPNDAGLCNAVVAYTVTANGTPTPTYSYVFTGATMGSGSGTGSNSTFLKGNTTVTVTATNPCGAPTCVFTITVNDTEKPVITRTGAATVNVCKNNSYTDAGATANDNCDGDLTMMIVTDNPVNTSVSATYVVKYDVSDAAGNAAIQVTRTVVVHDLPVPTCPSNFNACKTGGNKTLTGASPSGGVYSGPDVSGGIFNPVVAGVGVHSITYTYTDGNGCVGACTFDITVFDPPIYNVNDNMYYCTLAEAVAAGLTNDGDELQIPTGVYNDPCILINKSVMITPMGGSVTIECLQMNGVGKAMKLGGNLTINQLTLTNGNVRTNGNNLKCGTISGGSAASYVITD